MKKKIKKEKHKRYYNSNTNCLLYGGDSRLTEIPRMICLRIKWAYQRIKYGYCDYDIYDVDYWISRTLSSALYRLAEITHGYPLAQVAQYLHDKEIGFVRDDYDELSEEFSHLNFSEIDEDECFEEWQNILRDIANRLSSYSLEFFDTEDYERYKDDKEMLYKLWNEYENTNYKRAKEALVEVSKWFGHLWD